jgi:peptidyl-prolyl cis-trans isomerase D
MQTLRNYMKHVIWIVGGGFLLMLVFSWGMGGFNRRGSSPMEKGIIGVIDGQKIMYHDFATAVQRQADALKEQSNTPVSEYQINSIRQRVWQSLEQEILFAKEIKRLKLEASPEEIVFNLRNNPPPFLQSNEVFQTDGQFDMSKYQQALADPQNYKNWIPVEDYFRTTIPSYKLQQLIISTVRVTDNEVLEAYSLENEKVNARYILFDQTTISDENIVIPDMEMEDYYKGHNEEYREPEKRKIQYVLFEAKPSAEDSLQTRYDMEDIQRRLKEGADFEEVAKESSEDESNASKGGDLGFFGKGTMVKPFEEVAFAGKVGEIVGPVETPFGLHLIQIVARKTENNETQVHARHILLKYKMSSETYNGINERSEYLSSELSKLKKGDFTEFVEQEGYTVQETPLFQKGGFIPGIGMSSQIGHYAFQGDVGWISSPISFNENIVLFRISEIQKERIKPFEDVKTTIESILKRQKQKERAGKFSQAIWSAISSGMDIEKVAEANNLKVNDTGLFSMQSTIPGVGRDPNFLGKAFRLSVGEISEPFEGERGYYILQVLDHHAIDEKMFESEKESKKVALLQEKKRTVFMAWYTQLQEAAKIKDYRDQYF